MISYKYQFEICKELQSYDTIRLVNLAKNLDRIEKERAYPSEIPADIKSLCDKCPALMGIRDSVSTVRELLANEIWNMVIADSLTPNNLS